jgi:hypothetical protein
MKDMLGRTAFDAINEQADAKWTTKGDEIKEETTNKIPPEINGERSTIRKINRVRNKRTYIPHQNYY